MRRVGMSDDRISGRIVDVVTDDIFPGCIEFADGVITNIKRTGSAPDRCLVPTAGRRVKPRVYFR